jgi:hypothetical protein
LLQNARYYYGQLSWAEEEEEEEEEEERRRRRRRTREIYSKLTQ